MKSICLSILLLAISAFGHAQFLLTPDGFKTADGKNYYVIDAPGYSKQQLFEMVDRRAIASFGTHRNRVVSGEPDEVLIEATNKNQLNYRDWDFDILFNTSFEFKDGKIKVNAPLIKSMKSYFGNTDSLRANFYIKSPTNIFNRNAVVFDDRDKLRNKELKIALEELFNNNILQSLTQLTVSSDW